MSIIEKLKDGQRELIRATAGAALRAKAKRADNSERVAELVNLRAEDPTPLDLADFVAKGKEINVHPAIIHSVANTESFGRGFEIVQDPDGQGGTVEGARALTMVEPHIFSELSFHAFDGPLYGVSYPRQVKFVRGEPPPPGFDRHPYTFSQDERWGLFANMALLDTEAAIGAVSLGRFQQLVGSPRPSMGWKLLRFPSAESLFRELCKSEASQFEIFVRFFRANGALGVLRSANWTDIARVYNGPGNVEAYSRRMQAEYQRVARHYQ